MSVIWDAKIKQLSEAGLVDIQSPQKSKQMELACKHTGRILCSC